MIINKISLVCAQDALLIPYVCRMVYFVLTEKVVIDIYQTEFSCGIHLYHIVCNNETWSVYFHDFLNTFSVINYLRDE